MTRNQSRGISRRRTRIEALSPCTTFSHAMGIIPFYSLLQSSGLADQNKSEEEKEIDRQNAHAIKMRTDQRSAKARQERKRNKV